MANEIKAKFLVPEVVTITLTSLGNGAGRISTEIDNTTKRASRGYFVVKLKTATAPTSSTAIKLYLIRNSDPGSANITNIQEGVQANTSYTLLGTADAAVSVEPFNAQIIAALQVTATANAFYTFVTDVIIDPGPKFSLIVWNAIGQALSSTAADHVVNWVPFNDEIQ